MSNVTSKWFKFSHQILNFPPNIDFPAKNFISRQILNFLPIWTRALQWQLSHWSQRVHAGSSVRASLKGKISVLDPHSFSVDPDPACWGNDCGPMNKIKIKENKYLYRSHLYINDVWKWSQWCGFDFVDLKCAENYLLCCLNFFQTVSVQSSKN